MAALIYVLGRSMPRETVMIEAASHYGQMQLSRRQQAGRSLVRHVHSATTGISISGRTELKLDLGHLIIRVCPHLPYGSIERKSVSVLNDSDALIYTLGTHHILDPLPCPVHIPTHLKQI
jgi:hypothetical protein